MNNCSISLQVLPNGVDKQKLFEIVDRVIAYIKSENVHFVVGPFDTTMEGDFDHLMRIVYHAQKLSAELGGSGVFSNVKIDYNPDGVWEIGEKIDKYDRV